MDTLIQELHLFARRKMYRKQPQIFFDPTKPTVSKCMCVVEDISKSRLSRIVSLDHPFVELGVLGEHQVRGEHHELAGRILKLGRTRPGALFSRVALNLLWGPLLLLLVFECVHICACVRLYFTSGGVGGRGAIKRRGAQRGHRKKEGAKPSQAAPSRGVSRRHKPLT